MNSKDKTIAVMLDGVDATDLKPTRTNWDALREDKQKVAVMAVAKNGYYDTWHWALLAQNRHATRDAAIAANLAWLDAPVANDNDKEGIT